MAVKFFNDDCGFRLRHKRRIAAWIKEAALREGFGVGDISVVFCSPQRHLEINRQYLSHDYNTDVITFDYSEGDMISGDIFIDPQTVADNARIYGRPAAEELLRVVIHGALHLMGYKDKTAAQQSTMRAREDLYLRLWDDIPAADRTVGNKLRNGI